MSVPGDKICQLLHEVKRVAMHASLTGSLRKSTPTLVDIYNKCLDSIAEQGDPLVKTLFPTLRGDQADVDQVGAAAALLASYVRPSEGRREVLDIGEDEA